MVRALRALLEFIYLARRTILDTKAIREMEDALERFHKYVRIFVEEGIRKENSTPPRQHSLMHYIKSLRAFGAPNGLCSSITKSKHIKAIKQPWQRSNHFRALGQMLLTNQHLDKLAASRADFANREMLNGTCISETLANLSEYYVHPTSSTPSSSWHMSERVRQVKKHPLVSHSKLSQTRHQLTMRTMKTKLQGHK